MRKLLSAIAGAGLLVTLSACAAQPPTGFAGCDTGSSAALVQVDGSAVTFPTPLVSSESENAVLEAGDGAPVQLTDAAIATVTFLDATTGQTMIAPTNILTRIDGKMPYTTALTCANEGGRVAVLGTIGDLAADQVTTDNPDALVVVVTDIEETFPGRATGSDRVPSPGFPSIVLAPNGQPGFTMLNSAPPTTLSTSVLKQGSGATVKAGDSAIVNLTGIVWGGTETFLSSWSGLGPTQITVADMATAERGVPAGLAEAIAGQQVGSQIIVIVPPSAGYPAGSAPTGVTETSTLVFVVDILKID